MKSYSEFVNEIRPCGCQDCDCNDKEYVNEEAVELNEMFSLFSKAVAKLLRRDASSMIAKISQSANQAQEMLNAAVTITKQIEKGEILLKTDMDIQNFKTTAISSGLYSRDGSKRDRSDKEVKKHVEVVIAKNRATQISDNKLKEYFSDFLNQVGEDNYCGT